MLAASAAVAWNVILETRSVALRRILAQASTEAGIRLPNHYLGCQVPWCLHPFVSVPLVNFIDEYSSRSAACRWPNLCTPRSNLRPQGQVAFASVCLLPASGWQYWSA